MYHIEKNHCYVCIKALKDCFNSMSKVAAYNSDTFDKPYNYQELSDALKGFSFHKLMPLIAAQARKVCMSQYFSVLTERIFLRPLLSGDEG